jgi:hypothetical protein
VRRKVVQKKIGKISLAFFRPLFYNVRNSFKSIPHETSGSPREVYVYVPSVQTRSLTSSFSRHGDAFLRLGFTVWLHLTPLSRVLWKVTVAQLVEDVARLCGTRRFHYAFMGALQHCINSAFCPRSLFVCSVWFSQQAATVSLYSINRLGSVAET